MKLNLIIIFLSINLFILNTKAEVNKFRYRLNLPLTCQVQKCLEKEKITWRNWDDSKDIIFMVYQHSNPLIDPVLALRSCFNDNRIGERKIQNGYDINLFTPYTADQTFVNHRVEPPYFMAQPSKNCNEPQVAEIFDDTIESKAVF